MASHEHCIVHELSPVAIVQEPVITLVLSGGIALISMPSPSAPEIIAVTTVPESETEWNLGCATVRNLDISPITAHPDCRIGAI